MQTFATYGGARRGTPVFSFIRVDDAPIHLRCNIEQAEQVFTALTHLKVPTRFVRYPRETSHGMSRAGPPDMRLHRLDEILTWMGRYLKR